MVDVSSSKNSITITVGSANKNNSVVITPGTANNSVTTKSDTAQYWSNLSKDYSEQAKTSAYKAEQVKNEIITQKDSIIADIENTGVDAIDSINKTKTDIITDIEFVADGEKQEIEELIDSGKDEIKESIGNVKVLTTLEIGDIGIAPLGIDETKGKRRYLNGQIVIQDQYTEFTNKVKSAVALYPSLACTEPEWQTNVTMSTYGQCGKFVVDDNAGTIRLPKIIMPIQGLTNLANLGEIVEAGLPNITASVGGGYNYVFINGTGAFISRNLGNTHNINISGTSNIDNGVAFDASKSNPTYGKSNTVQQEQIQYPYFIQVATGAETEDNIINEIELNNPFSLLDYKYSEYELDNISWLRSNGQYNSKTVYPAVYDLLLKIYNGTETKAGVSVKLSTEVFTDYDFVLNTANETFRLPIKVKQKYLNAINGNMPVIGNGMTLGLSTGNGGVGLYSNQQGDLYGFAESYGTNIGSKPSTINYYQDFTLGLTTDATKSGIVAKVSQSEVSGLYLYFYVGETVQNANLINAGRIEEKVVDIKAELPHKLNDNQITNCLLEVPQRIKLELNGGTLTLKAGSKVIVPNGVGVFDVVTVQNDLLYGGSGISWSNTKLLVYSPNGTLFVNNGDYTSGSTYSGGTYGIWYDTANNLVKYTSDGGSTWVSGYSLPLAQITITSGIGVTSIDQVFNGMGYIGSTVWVDKGVKGLACNGRNEDGTLNNQEFITSKIYTQTAPNATYPASFAIEPQNDVFQLRNITTWSYNKEENFFDWTGGSRKYSLCEVANVNINAGIISSFQPKLPFRAVDYSDLQSGTSFKTVVETYKSGTSWYRVWSDGYCEQGGVVASSANSVTLLKQFADTNYYVNAHLLGDSLAVTYHTIIANKSTTGFGIASGQYYSAPSNLQYPAIWEAKGYIK